RQTSSWRDSSLERLVPAQHRLLHTADGVPAIGARVHACISEEAKDQGSGLEQVPLAARISWSPECARMVSIYCVARSASRKMREIAASLPKAIATLQK